LASILVLHGPNLNLLGRREPDTYGRESLDAINERLRARAGEAGHRLVSVQSNAEHELVERIQQAGDQGVAAIIINPAAFTHTSVALRDALLAVALPFVEVHLSNIHRREPFRRQSWFSDIAEGVITGLGGQGYDLALEAVLTRIQSESTG